MSVNIMHTTGLRFIQTGNIWHDQTVPEAVTMSAVGLKQYLNKQAHVVSNNQDAQGERPCLIFALAKAYFWEKLPVCPF